MSQQDVVLAVEGSGKAGAKAIILDLCKDGGAIDLEAKEMAAENAVLGAVLLAVVPVFKSLLQSVAAKLG